MTLRPTSRQVPGDAPGQVLVIEDDPTVRSLLLLNLDLAGHRTDAAQDGAHAVKIAAGTDLDLVVLDPGLPDTSGPALLAELRAMPHLRATRFLVVSGTAHQHQLIDLLQAGAHDYLRKPFAPLELTARVEACLRSKREVDTLLAAALHDPLTGLLNRRGGEQALRRTAAHARRAREPMAVLMVDIDSFKTINDRHGHQLGDLALRHVADRLSNALRQGDLLCRWGGDEFLAMLPDTDGASAQAVAQRTELLVRTAPLPLRHGGHALAVTVGAAASEPRGHDLTYTPDVTQLLAQADQDLYAQREQGRAPQCLPTAAPLQGDNDHAALVSPDEQLMTIVEVAYFFGVSTSTVSRWTKTGRLEVLELPEGRRFRPEDVLRLHRRTNPPQ